MSGPNVPAERGGIDRRRQGEGEGCESGSRDYTRDIRQDPISDEWKELAKAEEPLSPFPSSETVTMPDTGVGRTVKNR